MFRIGFDTCIFILYSAQVITASTHTHTHTYTRISDSLLSSRPGLGHSPSSVGPVPRDHPRCEGRDPRGASCICHLSCRHVSPRLRPHLQRRHSKIVRQIRHPCECAARHKGWRVRQLKLQSSQHHDHMRLLRFVEDLLGGAPPPPAPEPQDTWDVSWDELMQWDIPIDIFGWVNTISMIPFLTCYVTDR